MSTKRVTAEVDAQLHKAALVAAAVTGKTFREVVEDAMREWVNSCSAARAILKGPDGE